MQSPAQTTELEPTDSQEPPTMADKKRARKPSNARPPEKKIAAKKPKKTGAKSAKPKSKPRRASVKKPSRKSAKAKTRAKSPSGNLGPRGGKPGNGTQRQTKSGLKFHIMSVHMPMDLLSKLGKRVKADETSRSAFAISLLARALKSAHK
jgi:outer membrane biosynthesis protein TonB